MRIRTDEAIRSLKPNALFSVTETANGERTVNWISKDITQPTDSELDAEVLRLQAIEDGLEWSRNRAKEYPSIVDQLDDIYHNGIDAWKATIKATKDKYPKP